LAWLTSSDSGRPHQLTMNFNSTSYSKRHGFCMTVSTDVFGVSACAGKMDLLAVICVVTFLLLPFLFDLASKTVMEFLFDESAFRPVDAGAPIYSLIKKSDLI
jgi:hypothetical protein